MADPPSRGNSGFPARQNQPFPTPANCVMGNPQLLSTNSSNMMQNLIQIPNMLQNQVMPVPNMPHPITRPVFSGAASNFGAFQNNQLVPPQIGLLGSTSQLGQFSMGFNHGNSVHDVNSAALLALLGQIVQNSAQVNLSQSQGQLFNPGFMNGPQQQHNMNMPNGQFLGPGVMQNLSQFGSMQGVNPSQVAPCAFLPCSQPVLGVPNQVSQGIIPQIANFNTNPPFGVGQYNQAGQLLNQNSGNFVSCAMGGNGLSPSIFQSQLQGNASDPHGSCLAQNMRPSAIAYSEGDPVHSSRTDNSDSNWENTPPKSFMKKPVGGEFQRGCRKFMKKPNGGQFEGRFQKFNSHNMNDGGRKLGFPDMHMGKGSNMKGRRKFDCDTSTPGNKGVKRSINVYSEEEIKQWRESRRNNYPSQRNLEKKQGAKLDPSELTCRETQLKNELAEVLSKQVKLGVEVAELPPEYLLDPAQQGPRNKDTKMSMNKHRNRNKFNKRQGYNKQDRFSKKQKLDNEMISNDDASRLLSDIHPGQTGSGAAVPSNYTHHTEKQDPASEERNKLSTKETVNNKFNKRGGHNKKRRFDKKQKLANRNQREDCASKREPTLLQKLLGADISRDKSRLLHVFRFMVMNSFFKDWPDKPLTYPSVIIDGVKHECDAEERVSLSEGSSKQGAKNMVAEEFVSSNCNIDSDKEDDVGENLDENRTQNPDTLYAIGKECNDGQSEEPDQEEGEIVD